jgi:hypothetical protein
MNKKRKPGQPKAGGPRKQIRFKKDIHVKAIERAVKLLNAGMSEVGQVTFNSFVSGTAHARAVEILKGKGK